MKRINLSIFFFFLITYSTLAQLPDRTAFDVKMMLPTSPDAAMLGRFGDIPIGYYTGTADISIPLYTIEEAGLQIPISMKYHSSGIKVQDESGWVGLGWSLEPAGAIIQSVNGQQDQLDHLVDYPIDGYDFLKENMLLANYSSKLTSNTSTALGRALGYGEGQPDYYYFNFPGFSGKFYINPENKEIVQIDKKATLFIVKNSPESWTITTLDGNKFIFNVMEVATGLSVSEIAGYSWKLSKIQLHNGREINFEYSDGFYNSYYKTQTWHDPYGLSYDNGGFKDFTNWAAHQIKYLKSISAPLAKVEFELEDREDLFGQNDNDNISGNGSLSTKRLKTVVIKNPFTLEAIKSFNLDYDYFSYSMLGGNFLNNTVDYDKLGKRLKLTSVKENGYNETGQITSFPPYTFVYEESVLLPLKTSYARDFWGYYNGKNNSRLLPDMSYYLYSGYPEYQSIPASVLSAYTNGANRSVNNNTVQAGMLKRINYPTGGYSLFDYESNTFSNYTYPDLDQIAASSVDQVVEDKNNTNDTRNRQFTIPNSLTVHFVVTINRGPNTSLTFTDMLPCTATLTRVGVGGSNITPIKTWQMQSTQAYSQDFAADGVVTWTEDLALEYVPNTYYVINAGLSDALGPQNTSTNSASVSARYSYTYMINSGAKSNGAGLRIKSIQNFNAEGVVSTQKKLSYIEANVSSGILMSPLKHFFNRKMDFQRITYYGPSCLVDKTSANIWFVSADGYIPFSDAAMGNAVGYSKVTEENIFSDGNNGFHNFYFHNQQSNTRVNSPPIPDLRNGLLLREELLSKSMDTVKKVMNFYEEKEAKFFRGFKIFENQLGEQWDPQCNGLPPGVRYTIDSYPNNAQWFLQDRQITWDYFAGSKVKSEKYFTYNSLGQLKERKTWDSNGKEIIKKTIYLIDAPNTQNYSLLYNYGLFNSIIEELTTIDNNDVEQIKNYYNSFNGYSPALYRSESAFGDGNFQEDLSLEYGDFKKPILIRQKNKSTVIIWSYNSLYPMVRIENGDLNIIRSILGDQNLTNFMRLTNPSTSQINSFLSPLHLHPSLNAALLTRFNYRPLFGLSSQTDARGKTAYYEYDEFQRLKNVKDQNGNVIKNNIYHYKD